VGEVGSRGKEVALAILQAVRGETAAVTHRDVEPLAR
jgi:hypothetical protein